MSNQVYEIVTERIIKKLEAGVIPWRKPWREGNAVSWDRQRAYRGINAMLLDAGEYATFKTIQAHGGTVKKGEKGHLVVFWKWIDVKDADADEGTDETKKIPYLRYYKVFEINTQTEGLKSKRKTGPIAELNPIEEAEKIIAGYQDSPPITRAGGRAYYRPSTDEINVPPLELYNNAAEFYSTTFHEMIHSTGHQSRLNRKDVVKTAAFGSEDYSKEELVAEIGAAMLCTLAQIEQTTIDNSASYIKSWLRVLKDDVKMVVLAAGAAQKAADYIQGIKAQAQEA